jgi:hypothetical protein
MLTLLTSDYSSSPFVRRARTLIAAAERQTTASAAPRIEPPAPRPDTAAPKTEPKRVVDTPKDEPQRGNVAAPASIEASCRRRS